MSKVTRSLAAYGAGIAIACVVSLMLVPTAGYRDWAYHYFRGDYLKVGWVYDGMIVAERPVTNLFMGSSHVYNGVDDSQIAKALGTPSAAYNAAIPTSGRDLEYVVLRDILQRNRPKRLFIEVRETEERTSHFGFPILASASDVLTAPPGPSWLSNFLQALQYRFEYLTSRVPLLRREDPVRSQTHEFGFVPNPHQEARDVLLRREEEMKRTKRWRVLPNAFGDLEFAASEDYLLKLSQLCRAQGIELHFLYLPFLGAPREPAQLAFYRRIGTLHEMPDSIRNDARYWSDITHFNATGAKAYTQWLIETVLRDPRSGSEKEASDQARLR